MVEEVMTQELLPCPFCGGEAAINEIRRDGYHFAECESCAVGMCAERTKAEAITTWNTRTQSGNWQETLNELARLEAEVQWWRGAAKALAEREAEYRKAHDLHGGGASTTGRAWDLMRRQGDRIREAISPA